jgi:hypothetical protein
MLEFATCVWSPHSVGLTKKIESVQRRFTKRFVGYRSLTYDERLISLGLVRLELRRLHFDLIYVYKILFGMVETDISGFFTVSRPETGIVTRGHNFKLFVPQSRIDVRKYFFCHRVLRCWNSLPAQPDDFLSLNNFKRLLDRTDLSNFLLRCD